MKTGLLKLLGCALTCTTPESHLLVLWWRVGVGVMLSQPLVCNSCLHFMLRAQAMFSSGPTAEQSPPKLWASCLQALLLYRAPLKAVYLWNVSPSDCTCTMAPPTSRLSSLRTCVIILVLIHSALEQPHPPPAGRHISGMSPLWALHLYQWLAPPSSCAPGQWLLHLGALPVCSGLTHLQVLHLCNAFLIF